MSRVTAQVARLPQSLGARMAALPPRRQERVQDAALGVAVAAVNVASLFPYRAHLHPLWLALTLVAAQGVPLAWRRSWPVPVLIVIAGARIAFDQVGFGFAPFALGPAIAFYTVIDLCGPLLRWLSVAGAIAGITISEAAPGHDLPYDAIFQATVFLTVWAAGTLSRSTRANLQAAQSRADRAEAELDRQAALAAERERTRIARELHDVVAHHVSLIAVQAEAAQSLLPGQPERARTSVEIIGDVARQALTELRRLLGVLRGPSDRLMTAPSASLGDLGEVLDQVRGAGLPVDLEVVGTPGLISPGVDLTAYRIVQEALTNSIRHSRAARASVRVCYEPGYVTVSITDSGQRPDRGPDGRPAADGGITDSGQRPDRGPDGRPAADGGITGRPGSLLTGSGLGLAGIAERVASCGGHLSVGPTPGTPGPGFNVTARLPSR